MMKRFEFVAKNLFVAVVGMESYIGAVTLQINTMSAHHFGKVFEFM